MSAMELRSRACCVIFFFQAEDGIRDVAVTGVQTCALPILIAMDEHPAAAVRQKADSSIVVGMRLVKDGRAGAFVSADRKSVVEGKSVDLGGRRIIKKKNTVVRNLIIAKLYSQFFQRRGQNV